MHVATLGETDYYGEQSLLSPAYREAYTLVAATKLVVLSLALEDITSQSDHVLCVLLTELSCRRG